jgi:hypothetical protein
MTGNWLLAQLQFQAPGLWLLLSLLSGLALLIAKPWLSNRLYGHLWTARWLLAPYLGLLCGGVSPRLMGLAAIDWRTSLSFGIAIVCGVLVFLTLVQTTIATNLGPDELEASKIPEKASSITALPMAARHVLRFLQSGTEEFHWAFLRGSLWELLLAAPNTPNDPAYAAVWLAAGTAAPGVLITQPTGLTRISKGVVLIATTILFFYTRNFWLCWLLHGAAWSIMQQQPAARLSGWAQK